MILLLTLALFLVLRVTWFALSPRHIAALRRYARCFFRRPVYGRRSSCLSKVTAIAEHGPDAVLPPSPPASHVLTAAVLVADISSEPDLDAFSLGVEVGIGITFFVLFGVVIVHLYRKHARG